jgi:tRNA-binding protein
MVFKPKYRMELISWSDFEKVDIRIGTIIKVEDFPEAHKPAYKIWVDLGNEIGIKKSSAQVTAFYSKDFLIGQQVQCVINFPKKQIGQFLSEILITGYANQEGHVILATLPGNSAVPNGAKLH